MARLKQNAAALCFFILIVPCAVFAESFSLFGMHFDCEGCSQIDNTTCAYSLRGEEVSIDCSELLTRLLQASLKKSSNVVKATPRPLSRIESPASEELMSYLVFGEKNDRAAFLALQLLISRGTGRALLASSFLKVHSSYPLVLEKLLRNSELPTEFLTGLWNFNELMSPVTRAMIVNSSNDLSVRDFFDSLSVADIELDIAQIREVIESGVLLSTSFSRQLSSAVEFLFSCKHSSSCLIGNGFPEPVLPYARRVQANRVLGLLSGPEVQNAEIVSALSELPYRSIRTPKMHALLRRVLNDPQFDLSSLTSKQFELVEYFSNYDSSLSSFKSSVKSKAIKSEPDVGPLGEFEKPKGFSWFIVLLSIALVSILAGLYLLSRKKQQGELAALRDYFELEKTDGAEELSQSFRRKARSLHPDTGHGDQLAFSEMNERYQRAKELL